MIAVNDLKKTYGAGTKAAEEVLHGVSFELPETGFVCILGRSGSGKTSLLNAIGGLDVFDSGSIEIDGTRVSRGNSGEMERQRNRNFGYVFQNYYMLPEHSVAYNVFLGLHSVDLNEREKLKRVEDALRKVNMLRFRKRLVGELSGGQQQRVAIARAIAKSPKVIFADEPTGHLDEESTLNICALLKKLSKTSLVVMVTHEERLANFFADRIIRIERGDIASDSSDWERGALISADKNAVYTGDYRDESFTGGAVKLRVLSAEGAESAEITLVVEDGRLIVKTDDKRLLTYSNSTVPPYIKEGGRPRLDRSQFETESQDEAETERPPLKRSGSAGLGLRMLLSELRTSASKKRIRNFANVLFIVLLSLMLLLSISDINAAAQVDPEKFITVDSHVIELYFDFGENYNSMSSQSLPDYISRFMKLLDETGLDFELIPDTTMRFTYSDGILPQYGYLSMSLGKYNLVSTDRLDPSTLVCGRMPERYDEIVVDRWVIEKCTEKDGIVQNFIPASEYLLGKRLYMERKNYYPTIVGISDSGQPSIYLSKPGIFSVGIHGTESIPYSEFVSITGRTDLKPLAPGECALVKENASKHYTDRLGTEYSINNIMPVYVREVVDGAFYDDYGITAPLILADEDFEPFLRRAVETVTHCDLWCADREAVKKAINEELIEKLGGVLSVEVRDTYEKEYAAFMARRSVSLQTRFVITAAVGLLSVVMLYVIQRFRVRERMGMVAVYRMLGIPGRDTMGVFIWENIMLTLKFAVPTVLLAWAGIAVLPMLGVGGLSISIPLWVPFVTIAAILAAETVVAILAVFRLIGMPPAKLAAKYDF